MKRTFATIALIIMCAIFIVGLILVFSAPSIGDKVGWIGSSRTSDRLSDATIISCQIGGAVMALVGGLGMIVSGYAWHRER